MALIRDHASAALSGGRWRAHQVGGAVGVLSGLYPPLLLSVFEATAGSFGIDFGDEAADPAAQLGGGQPLRLGQDLVGDGGGFGVVDQSRLLAQDPRPGHVDTAGLQGSQHLRKAFQIEGELHQRISRPGREGERRRYLVGDELVDPSGALWWRAGDTGRGVGQLGHISQQLRLQVRNQTGTGPHQLHQLIPVQLPPIDPSQAPSQERPRFDVFQPSGG